jgi:MoaA/NifB/PqqE/SkfB family radical SAM enzyme
MGSSINNPQFWRTEGITEDEIKDYEIEVDKNGNIKLPDLIRDKLNLENGTILKLKFSNNKIKIKRADPSLSKVYIEPTTGCNLDCKTCVRHAWDEKIGSMKFSSYKKIIDDLQKFNSIKKISLWGIGEPLYHPDIVKMVQRAKSLNVKTQIITNGLLLDEEMSKSLLKAGLDSLIVSIDGTSPETMSDIRSGADLNKVIKNIKKFNYLKKNKVKTNTEIGIEFVVMKSNVNELKDLRKIAFELGASFIFLTNLLPYTEAMTNEILYSNSISRSKPKNRTPLRPEVYLPPTDLEEKTVKFISKIMGKTSSISTEQIPFDSHGGYCKFVQEGSVSINWKGEISPCIPLMHSYNCYIRERKKYIEEYHLGNTNNKTIYEIWNSDEFKNFRKNVIEFPFSECTQCSGCNLSKTNKEDCHGNEFPVCGDCLWAKGVIQCP